MTVEDRPSVAELIALHEDMTPGPYRYDQQGYIETVDHDTCANGAETEVLVLGARNSHDDGDGAVALLNSAPSLLEIAAAALDHEDARQAFEWSSANEDRPIFEAKRVAMQQAHRELLAALAKVKR